MDTAYKRKQLRKAIERYVQAGINDSWKGSQMPEDWPEIEEELAKAIVALDKLIRKLIPKESK